VVIRYGKTKAGGTSTIAVALSSLSHFVLLVLTHSVLLELS
jgi:hypothetical protein